jgi:hypothetical protein
MLDARKTVAVAAGCRRYQLIALGGRGRAPSGSRTADYEHLDHEHRVDGCTAE